MKNAYSCNARGGNALNLGYTEAQEAIRKLVRDFAQNEIAPGAEERDRTGEFPYALYRKLGELGITSMRFPKDYGGTDADYLSFCLAVEELGKVDCNIAVTMVVTVAMGQTILDIGTEEQIRDWREKWTLPIARGEATAGGGATEPDCGSDTAAIKTTALLDGNEWVINGSKAFITNAGLTTTPFVMVIARMNKEGTRFGNFMVPTGTPGYTIMPKYRKMGLRSSDTRELAFDDCRIPAGNLLGGDKIDAREYFVGPLQMEGRVANSCPALGLAGACFEESLKYAQSRIAFKRPISKFQYVQGMLVDMALELELSRLLRDKAAMMVEEGKLDWKISSMVKYYCTESAKRAADVAVQIHGGTGFMDECPVSRYHRDIRAFTIFDGTTEIQKWVIARELGC